MSDLEGDDINRVDDVALWSWLDNPAFPTTTYPNVNDDFYFDMAAGMYMLDPDYLAYLLNYMDEYYDSGSYVYDSFFSYYDGWLLCLYVTTIYYDWNNGGAGRNMESFGACIGDSCGGAWMYSYYYYYDISSYGLYTYTIPIYFYEASPDASTPNVPYSYDSSYVTS